MDPRYGDMSEHRVSMLGSSLRRPEDPEQSRDPRVRELVEALKTVDYAPAPAPHFRADLRAQLVAVAPRIIAESAGRATVEAEPAPARLTSTRGTSLRTDEPLSAQERRRRFTRPLTVAAGVAAAFLLLFGGAVWKSQNSLPGDSLYGLKRASENVQLSLSSGGTDRGHEYLSLAQRRVEEARALLRRASSSAAGAGTLAGGLSPQTASLISANLASADADLTHGTDLLNTQAVAAKSQSPITVLTAWAPGQLSRLQDLAGALPAGAVQNRTRSSWTLTNSALTRARSLAPAVAAGCVSTSDSDHLGPVPACGTAPTTTPTPRVPASSPIPAPTRSAGTGGSAGTGTTRRPAGRPDSTTAPTTSAPAGRSGTQPVTSPVLLPRAPVSIGSCGISVALGPIGVGIGGCPSHS